MKDEPNKNKAGRKPLPEDEKKVEIKVYLPPKVAAAMREIVLRDDSTASRFVNDAIKAQIQRDKLGE